MVIGIAGKSCSGKNKVAKILLDKFEFYELDGDKIGHEILKEKAQEVSKEFNLPLNPKLESVDRKLLAKIVFSDKEKLKKLEEILYPHIKKKIQNKIKTEKNFSINMVKLFESGIYQFCDAIIWVKASNKIRLKRALKRDTQSRKEILTRFNAQKKLSSQPWKKKADIYKVNNNRSHQMLNKRVCKVLKDINKRR